MGDVANLGPFHETLMKSIDEKPRRGEFVWGRRSRSLLSPSPPIHPIYPHYLLANTVILTGPLDS